MAVCFCIVFANVHLRNRNISSVFASLLPIHTARYTYTYGHFPPSALAPVSHAVQRLHQFAMLKEIAHQEYDERCEYENWDASCLETLHMTVKTPFKMQRYRFTPWFRGFAVPCFRGRAHGHTCTRTFA